MPADLTVGQFVYVIRKRIRVSPEQVGGHSTHSNAYRSAAYPQACGSTCSSVGRVTAALCTIGKHTRCHVARLACTQSSTAKLSCSLPLHSLYLFFFHCLLQAIFMFVRNVLPPTGALVRLAARGCAVAGGGSAARQSNAARPPAVDQ